MWGTGTPPAAPTRRKNLLRHGGAGTNGAAAPASPPPGSPGPPRRPPALPDPSTTAGEPAFIVQKKERVRIKCEKTANFFFFLGGWVEGGVGVFWVPSF